MAFWAYFDASALIKRYTQESGTPVVNEVFRLAPADRRICLSLGLLEVISILVRKRNDGRIQEDFFRKALTAFKAEVVQDERFSKLSVNDALILDSSELIERYGLNATDAILLRSVLETRTSQDRADDLLLLTSDKRLVRAARSEGVSALDPEIDSLAGVQSLFPPTE